MMWLWFVASRVLLVAAELLARERNVLSVGSKARKREHLPAPQTSLAKPRHFFLACEQDGCSIR